MGRIICESMLEGRMTHIIGEIATAENNREQCRVLMRLAKRPEDRAVYKREFRKERNRLLTLKRKMDYERKMSDLAGDLD